VFNKPAEFSFEPGQAAGLTLDEKGWRDEDRPFTMTSIPQDQTLDFVIKSYPDHDGVTKQIPDMQPGDQVFLDGPFGAITDHGIGTFIAGGAGVTPFISILKKQAPAGKQGSHLIFANTTEEDIILKGLWDSLKGLETTFVISDDADTQYRKGIVDKDLLSDVVTDLDQPFYICGPGEMVDSVRDALKEMGVADDKILTEDGW
jgi:predicted ferric reductase